MYIKYLALWMLPMFGGSLSGVGIANLSNDRLAAAASLLIGLVICMASAYLPPWREYFGNAKADDEDDDGTEKGGHENEARTHGEAQEEDDQGLRDAAQLPSAGEAEGEVAEEASKKESGRSYETMQDRYKALRQGFIDQGVHPDVATMKARSQLEAKPFA